MGWRRELLEVGIYYAIIGLVNGSLIVGFVYLWWYLSVPGFGRC